MKMWNRLSSFLRSSCGTVALEFAICFPLFIILFYQYIGVYQNIRLLSNLERATACLGDVLVNAKASAISPDVDVILSTVMNTEASITDSAIQSAFLSMVGKTSVHGTIRVSYQSSSGTEDIKVRSIQVNGGATHYDSSVESQLKLNNLLKTTARDVNGNPEDQYKHELLMVYACVDNPVKSYGVVTVLFFPDKYCSTFVAARRK